MAERVRVERVRAISADLLDRVNRRFPDHGWEAASAAHFCADDANVLLIAYRLRCLDERRAQLFIDEVDVHADSQRRGIGRAMLTAILRIAREMGAGEAWVQTHASNEPAVGLYHAIGGIPEDPDETILSFAFKTQAF